MSIVTILTVVRHTQVNHSLAATIHINPVTLCVKHHFLTSLLASIHHLYHLKIVSQSLRFP